MLFHLERASLMRQRGNLVRVVTTLRLPWVNLSIILRLTPLKSYEVQLINLPWPVSEVLSDLVICCEDAAGGFCPMKFLF